MLPTQLLSQTLNTSLSPAHVQEVNTTGGQVMPNSSSGLDRDCLKLYGGGAGEPQGKGCMGKGGGLSQKGPIKRGEVMLFKIELTVCLHSVTSS